MRFADGSGLILMDIILSVIEACIITGIMLVLILIFNKAYISKNDNMSIKEAFILILPSIAGVFSYRIALYFNSVDSADITIIVNDKIFCRLLLADMHVANVVSGCARQY